MPGKRTEKVLNKGGEVEKVELGMRPPTWRAYAPEGRRNNKEMGGEVGDLETWGRERPEVRGQSGTQRMNRALRVLGDWCRFP